MASAALVWFLVACALVLLALAVWAAVSRGVHLRIMASLCPDRQRRRARSVYMGFEDAEAYEAPRLNEIEEEEGMLRLKDFTMLDELGAGAFAKVPERAT